MKRIISSLTLALICTCAQAELKVGQTAPDIQTTASLDGKAFNYSLKSALKKGPVVVYFYPSAYTNGCNIQAHTFAELSDEFKSAGASVIGVSLDSIERLNEFSSDPDFCAGKLALVSDADGKIAKAYEVNVREAVQGRKDTRGQAIDHGFSERTTFVVTPDGKISEVIGGLRPITNVEAALVAVKRIKSQHVKH
ncbi:MAG: hypothetical protein RIR18_2448 [Pseudomonadota bacterium]